MNQITAASQKQGKTSQKCHRWSVTWKGLWRWDIRIIEIYWANVVWGATIRPIVTWLYFLLKLCRYPKQRWNYVTMCM